MNEDNPRPYSVRLPEPLRSQLEDIAKTNGRSLHSEILLRLETSLQGKPIDITPELKQAVIQIVREELSKK